MDIYKCLYKLQGRVQMKYNEPTQSLLKRTSCPCSQIVFHMNECYNNLFCNSLQYAYNCPNTWHVFFFIIFEWMWIFESVMVPCKFSVSSIKMIIIKTHNTFFNLYFYVFLYNKLHLFLTHHVHYTPFMCAKGLLNF